MEGVVSVLRLLPPLFLLAATLYGQSSLDNARRAQALLGPEVWSRVIRVQNDARVSPYPKTLHALVFELAGILWFYTDADGTQSFSLHRGQVENEKSDFGPLLRDIEPGFARWSEVPPSKSVPPIGDGPLRNGCFIESVVALRERLTRGFDAGQPRLLSYYSTTRLGRMGHTVLAYESGNGLEIYDPGRPEQTFIFERSIGTDPLVIARALEGPQVENARYLQLRFTESASNTMAAALEERPNKVSRVGYRFCRA
jgi:hypothetical protein